MKLLLIILFPFVLSSQYKWYPKMTPEQDLTFDYYSNLGIVAISSDVLTHFTHKPILSGFIGLGLGLTRCVLERGLNGKAVSFLGGMTGSMVFVIKRHIKNERLDPDGYIQYYQEIKECKKWSLKRMNLVN